MYLNLNLTQTPTGAGATTTTTALSTQTLHPPKFTHPNPPLFTNRRPRFLPSSSTTSLSNLRNVIVSADVTNKSNKPSSTGFSDSDEQPSISVVGQENIPLEGVIQFEKPDTNFRFRKWGQVALLSGGDVLAIVLFSAIGRFSHGFSVFDAETFRTADPFIAGWVLSAYFLGGYGNDGRGVNGKTNAITAAFKSWALGVPLGILIRATSMGHIPPTRFIAVTLGSTALLLIGWRALVSNILTDNDKSKKNDMYKRGSPFELFELLTSLVRRW